MSPNITFETPPAGGMGLPAITPAQVALCHMVKGYLSPGDSDPGGTWVQRQALGDALLRAMRRSGIVEPTMEELIATLQHEVHLNLANTIHHDSTAYQAEVARSLRHHMRHTVNVDHLNLLFDALAQMVTTSTNLRAEESVGADDNSVMGFFLRRCWCDFTALPFESAITLARACCRFAGQGPAEQPGPELQETGRTFKPRVAVERWLAKVTAEMERRAWAEPREDLEADAIAVQSAAPRIPAAEATRARGAQLYLDSSDALQRVHQYFDRPLDPHVPSVGVVAAGEVPPPYIPGEMLGAAAPLRPRLQAAALAEGMLHARLGEIQPALDALNEAMHAAQQAGDDECLAHVLCALCQVYESATPGSLPEEFPPRGDQSVADRHVADLGKMLLECLRQSEDLAMPHLVGYSRLALAKYLLLHPPKPDNDFPEGPLGGEVDPLPPPKQPPALVGPPPPSVLAHETSAAVRYLSHLHLSTTVAAAVPVAPPSNSGFACLRILKGLADVFVTKEGVFGDSLLGARGSCAEEVRHLAAAAPLLKFSAWEHFGGQRLGLAHSLAFLQACGSAARADAACTALAQAAMGVCASHGPKAAEPFILLAGRRYPNSQNVALRAADLAIAHEKALYRRELRKATDLAGMLNGLTGPDEATRIGLHLDGQERLIRTMLARNLHAEAEKCLQGLFVVAQEARQPLSMARLVLLFGRIHLEADTPATAMPYVVRASMHAKDLHADLLGAEAAIIEAGCWTRLGRRHFERARMLVQGALPLILAHGHLELKGRARMALVEVLMARHDSKEGMAGQAARVIPLLHDAAQDFKALEDWQRTGYVHHLLALVYDATGETDKREAAAAEWCRFEDLKAAAFDPPKASGQQAAEPHPQQQQPSQQEQQQAQPSQQAQQEAELHGTPRAARAPREGGGNEPSNKRVLRSTQKKSATSSG